MGAETKGEPSFEFTQVGLVRSLNARQEDQAARNRVPGYGSVGEGIACGLPREVLQRAFDDSNEFVHDLRWKLRIGQDPKVT
jgi:hypothetical protein